MGHTIELCYDSATKTTIISSDNVFFDTGRIQGVDISKWIYPFFINGVKWYGIYEELRRFYKNSTFTITFDGAADEIETLKKAFKDKNVKVNAKYSNVIILYDESQFMTKITINGKIFDTQRIEKRSIDEWVLPFFI